MKTDSTIIQRVIGFDSHPDSFTAAIITGINPALAVVEKLFNKTPISQLQSWAKKHTTPQDTIVLEASGNSFEVVRSLARIQRKALVLESCQMGRLKEVHANNDKISAVRIGKAYLAGTAKIVWIPDLKTQERRDWFHAHEKAIKRTTQMRNRIISYLSDNGVRLKEGIPLATDKAAEQTLRAAKDWSSQQWQVLQIHLADLRHAEQARKQWKSLLAQEVLADPQLLALTRLCGVREVVAFALGAIIGDIHRFADPRKLVKYVGLDPAFDNSGENTWSGGIGGHGRKDLRSLLIESAQAIMSSKSPLAKWGWKLFLRKSSRNLAVAAIARKLTVAIWYLMMGRWTTLEEIDASLSLKVGKMISSVGKEGLKEMGKTRIAFRREIYGTLKNAKTYILYPERKLGDAVPQTP
jgi:transposase